MDPRNHVSSICLTGLIIAASLNCEHTAGWQHVEPGSQQVQVVTGWATSIQLSAGKQNFCNVPILIERPVKKYKG